jgi:hypothetical protein
VISSVCVLVLERKTREVGIPPSLLRIGLENQDEILLRENVAEKGISKNLDKESFLV